MLYILPTRRSLGVQLWGNHDDLKELYSVIGKYWGDEDRNRIPGYENRGLVISGFSYEVRHAFQETRLTKDRSDLHHDEGRYFGVQISWVHFLFSLAAIKQNMKLDIPNKLDSAIILQLEYWLESALENFDPFVAKDIIPFVNGALDGANEFLYQYMRSINVEYFTLGGGKDNFKKLPDLLKRGMLKGVEYVWFKKHLLKTAERLHCHPNDLDEEEDDAIYEIEW